MSRGPGEALRGFDALVRRMYRPVDPASLGVARALFGLCMVVDVVEERGLSSVDLKWGDPSACHFPLLHWLRPPGLLWMILIYGVMWLGAFGLMLGWRFRLSCGLFAVPYWYLHLLDKSYWNNHSYLFGLVALLFWGTEANRYMAVDARGRGGAGAVGVPYWNYFILKFQFFALYFIAGLKKASWEWLEGYSMTNLSRHWVFEPFKLFLTTELTDFYVVHWFGFLFDLTVGFFMLFEETRLPAMLLCTAFHLMNSRLFSIGMFPYVCLATMPLFCRPDWPRKLRRLPEGLTHPPREEARPCSGPGAKHRERRPSRRQRLVVALLLAHVALQLFLPYSHFVTKGYNNWVPGLYGYSWDMMVHAWDTGLVVVRVRDNESQKDHFLDPGAWVSNNRWARHGDMVRQYAHCIRGNLLRDEEEEEGARQRRRPREPLSSNISIYVDVWWSLNGRFQQRLFDPTVDMLRAEWHPFKPVSYVMPLLRQFSSYRPELDRIQRDVLSWSNYTDVLFVADYPGLSLEHYVEPELGNVTLRVLEGEVAYRPSTGKEGCPGRTIGKGGSVRVRAGRFHKVETTSPHPACYMYTFANRTKHQLATRGTKEETRVKEAFPIFKEISYKIDAFSRALGHIANALLHLAFGVPMVKRVSLD